MNQERMREGSRVPIDDSEVPYLERLGAQLRTYREDAALSRSAVAAAALISVGHLGQLEWGVRRTRRSTLKRIALAFHGDDVDPDALEEFVDSLVALAGPALAPESDYRERVESRRERRARKAAKAEDKVVNDSLPMARNLAVAAVDHSNERAMAELDGVEAVTYVPFRTADDVVNNILAELREAIPGAYERAMAEPKPSYGRHNEEQS